jgi:hypothetical protein
MSPGAMLEAVPPVVSGHMRHLRLQRLVISICRANGCPLIERSGVVTQVGAGDRA